MQRTPSRLFTFAVTFIALGVTAASAQVGYADATKAAIARNDMTICDTIDVEHWSTAGDDVGHSAAHWRVRCKIEFASRKMDPALCNLLPATASVEGWSARDSCLTYLAWALKRPELCESLKPDKYADAMVDSCRAGSISDIKQCSEGFRTAEWRDGVREKRRCIDAIAENLRDTSVCRLQSSRSYRSLCERSVKERQDWDAQLRVGLESK
jgi:hypothetical protein